MTTTVITNPTSRIAFPNLFEPTPATAKYDAGKYTARILIPKSDTELVAKINSAINKELIAKFKKVPSEWNNPIQDGDVYINKQVIDRDEAAYSEADTREHYSDYKGHYFINAKSGDQPKLIDRKLQPILDNTLLKSGDYAVVSFNLSAYDKESKGVGAYLNVVQFAKAGNPIGVPGATLAGFAELEDEDEEAFA